MPIKSTTKNTKTMYKVKEKYKSHLAKWAWTSLDLNASYPLEEWKAQGFMEHVLENC